MKPRVWSVFAFSLVVAAASLAQGGASAPAARNITLQEAVQLALRHNHVVRISGFEVEEKRTRQM
jgi:hypothetical protein